MSYPWIVVGIGDGWRSENLCTGECGPRRANIADASADLNYIASGGEPDALCGMDGETYADLEKQLLYSGLLHSSLHTSPL